MAESSDIPPSLSEVAVFVIQKQEVNLIVCSGHRFLVCHSPEVAFKVVVERADFFHFFWNPFSKAFICWSILRMSHSIKTLVATHPKMLEIKVKSSNFLIHVSLVLGLGWLCRLCWFSSRFW